MATTTSYTFLRLWDFPALRRELARLGLDWPEGQPGDGFVPELVSWKQSLPPASEGGGLTAPPPGSQLPMGVIFSGMLLAILFGAYMLTYQRRLFCAYGELDTLAAQQALVLQENHVALLHREKMQALGTMAAGVAHEFLATDYKVDRRTIRRTIRRDLQDLVQRNQLPPLVIEGEPE